MYKNDLFFQSSVDGIKMCIFLAIISNVTMSISIQAFVWTYVSSSPECVSRNRILSYMKTLCLTFSETAKLFSKWRCHFTIPWTIYEILASTCFFYCLFVFSFSNLSQCDVLSMVLICSTMITSDVEHSSGGYLPWRNGYSDPLLGLFSF